MTTNCCKKWGSGVFIKNGFVRGVQRCRCKNCRCNFTHTNRRSVHPALMAFGIVLYGMCGVFMNKIAKMFGVSGVAVLKRIRKEASLMQEVHPHAESKIVMIDETRRFVNGKKRRFGSGEPPAAYRYDLSGGNWALAAIHAAKN